MPRLPHHRPVRCCSRREQRGMGCLLRYRPPTHPHQGGQVQPKEGSMTDHGSTEPAPRDVIPNRMTRDGILAIDRMCCKPVRMTIPGELIEGPDGTPVGVGPNLASDEWLAPPRISRA